MASIGDDCARVSYPDDMSDRAVLAHIRRLLKEITPENKQETIYKIGLMVEEAFHPKLKSSVNMPREIKAQKDYCV